MSLQIENNKAEILFIYLTHLVGTLINNIVLEYKLQNTVTLKLHSLSL